MNQWWSWLLTVVGVTGLYFAGQKKAWAWLIGLGAQVLWLAYAVTTKQYGFVVSSFAYGLVYARNARLWMRTQCPHVAVRCVHGDEINAAGGVRVECVGCGKYLNHPLPYICTVTGAAHR